MDRPTHQVPSHVPRPVPPHVIAHRGSSGDNAEHTLGAYLAAMEEGADGLECDVRLTADGHLVCVHDRDLRRTAMRDQVVSTMELAELDRLDFAGWKRPWLDLDDEAGEVDPELTKVLTLRRLLETVADYPRRVDLVIETKHPTRYAGLVERRLVELLREFDWVGAGAPVRVMSFSVVALKRVERLAPDLEKVHLFDGVGEWFRARPVARPWWLAGPGIEVLREHPRTVARIAERTRVHCWTVNTETDVDLCRSLGVEALITDHPARIRKYLDS